MDAIEKLNMKDNYNVNIFEVSKGFRLYWDESGKHAISCDVQNNKKLGIIGEPDYYVDSYSLLCLMDKKTYVMKEKEKLEKLLKFCDENFKQSIDVLLFKSTLSKIKWNKWNNFLYAKINKVVLGINDTKEGFVFFTITKDKEPNVEFINFSPERVLLFADNNYYSRNIGFVFQKKEIKNDYKNHWEYKNILNFVNKLF